MHVTGQTSKQALTLALISVLIAACTAGDARFNLDTPAGFWFGLWHGVISVISLVIHLFNESVVVYEVHNSGGWYDLGFLLGVITIWGGGCHIKYKSAAQRCRDREWEEIGAKVEAKVMRRLKAWAESEDEVGDEADWDEVGAKVERKLKRKIKEWAEKE